MNKYCLLISLLVLSSFSVASAATIYDEGVNGDLSGVFSAPALLSVSVGPNTVIGQVGNNGNTGAVGGQDADYFTFTVPVNFLLNSITVDSYMFTGDAGEDGSFFGYVAGNSFTGQGSGSIDGFEIIDESDGEILDNLLSFDPISVLSAGDYAFWVQETGNSIVDYQITFGIVPVPVPAAIWLFGSAIFGLIGLRKKFA
ncbi:MAG: hypothetical protein AAF304_07850 [Pseudomonadota bacterium]